MRKACKVRFRERAKTGEKQGVLIFSCPLETARKFKAINFSTVGVNVSKGSRARKRAPALINWRGCILTTHVHLLRFVRSGEKEAKTGKPVQALNLLYSTIMPLSQKNILIIDEERFSRICSAILNCAGYATDVICEPDPPRLQDRLAKKPVSLIVTSYPYGLFLFDEIKGRNIPTILLSDNVDGDLIDILKHCENVYCMIKPVDYDHFKQLVSKVVSGDMTARGGYSLV